MNVQERLSAIGIRLQNYQPGWHQSTCPKCSPTRSKKNASCLSVKIDERGAKIICHHCGWVGGSHNPGIKPAMDLRSERGLSAQDLRRRKWAFDIWSSAIGISGTLAEAYFRKRAISGKLGPDLRFHPNLKHPSGKRCPALVARVLTGAGDFAAVQRIWLTCGATKADLEPAKATLGPLENGAVRLGAPSVTGVLGLAEGIETALSARDMFRFSVWAVLGAYRLSKAKLPPEVRRVVIFADNGQIGLKKAKEARRHYELQGLEAAIKAPDGEYSDHNDWLVARVAKHG